MTDAAVWHGYHASARRRAIRDYVLLPGTRPFARQQALHHARMMRAYRRAMQ